MTGSSEHFWLTWNVEEGCGYHFDEKNRHDTAQVTRNWLPKIANFVSTGEFGNFSLAT
jgi:hypothetical protein